MSSLKLIPVRFLSDLYCEQNIIFPFWNFYSLPKVSRMEKLIITVSINRISLRFDPFALLTFTD